MKIAIKGHLTKGKKVIQILESLGGVNSCNYVGNNFGAYYELHGNSIVCMSTKSDNYKHYTLEEFEKEFPFKIGDIVLSKGTNNPHEIVALEWFMNKLCYKLDNGIHYAPERLTTYKEMKEERNITLTLDKAKEWYNKGRELKEIALQAFTEKELTEVGLPKTWEEFCNTHPTKKGEYYIDNCSDISSQCESTEGRDIEINKNICPSKKSAEAHLAMIQLEQLRDCWRQGWKPNWLNCYETKYIIRVWRNNCTIDNTYVTHTFLSFPTYEIAKEFLECFRDLIEKAGDLI